MKYLGSISGRGVIQHDGVAIAEATYELEGYVQQVGGVTGSGEIGLNQVELQAVLEQSEVHLLTSENHLLKIRFSDKKIRAGAYVHVSVTGDRLAKEEWQH